MSNVVTLECVTCQKNYEIRNTDYTCPACGPLLGTLDVLYDYKKIAKSLTRKSLAENSNPSHWRYLPVLPIQKEQLIQPLAVGGTPIYASPKLASEFGIKHLWIKDDGRNPSASFKDRASSVAIVKALEKGAEIVTAASTGNAASSWSVFTALAGLPTYIFVPENAPKGKLAQLLLYGAKVIKVRGSYDDAFDLCCQAAEKWGWYNRSTAVNPYLGEGKKTGALEICEQLSWQVPDFVFVPTGDGCILQATWKGFKEFHELGLIDKLPKIIGVQAQGSAPLFHAWEKGSDQCEPLEAHTLADGISVGIPRDQVKALRAVRESDGRFITVSDEEILAAIGELAKKVGVLAEPAGAAGFAGFKNMAGRGYLDSAATAVILVTGHGLKDVDGILKAADAQPVLIENSLAAVTELLVADKE